ncbi:MAG: ribonuclease III [Rickettsiales bacterium]|nr:MAG: ribonuclease III [Rickettsiales bacterium]
MDYKELYKKLDYEFKDNKWLITALNHPSIHNINKKLPDYQRLEILGDSILSFVIVEFLLEKFPNINEGEVHIKKVELVKGETLSSIALKLGIGDYINMSRSEEMQGGRSNVKILEDVMEAIIGAIYKDSNIELTKKFILQKWKKLLNEKATKSPKTLLQEYLQKEHKSIPNYVGEELVNNGTETSYKITLKVAGVQDMEMITKTKKEGETELAKKMLKYLKNKA